MAHKDELDTSFIKNPTVAHEESDVRVRPLALFMIWLSVATAVVMLLMWGLFKYFDAEAARLDKLERPPLASERNPIPPKPLLQLGPTKPGQNAPDETNNSPLSEVNAVRKEENAKLENYTWADQSKGVVSLPIERAKELALERGLFKSRPQPAATPTASESPTPGTGENHGPGQPTGNAPGQGEPTKH